MTFVSTGSFDKLVHGASVRVRTVSKGRPRVVSTTVDAADGHVFPEYGYVLVAGWPGREGPVSVRVDDVELGVDLEIEVR